MFVDIFVSPISGINRTTQKKNMCKYFASIRDDVPRLFCSILVLGKNQFYGFSQQLISPFLEICGREFQAEAHIQANVNNKLKQVQGSNDHTRSKCAQYFMNAEHIILLYQFRPYIIQNLIFISNDGCCLCIFSVQIFRMQAKGTA